MEKSKKLKMSVGFVLVLLVGGVVTQVYSHCQIPCGIYDDDARLKEIAEHITTIEKGMKQIEELSQSDPRNMNQIVRWVSNKDDHADELGEIVTYYFMAQRVIPAAPESPDHKDYIRKLTLLHEMLVTSMKCKQTVGLGNVEKLKDLLKEFSAAYHE